MPLRRQENGCIDFDTNEPQFVLDERGEPVEILNICGLMAVPLQAGENRVEFRYTPPGLGLGLALTGAGWAAFALLTAQEVRQAQRKRRKARGGDEEEPAAEEIGGRNRPLAQPYP